MLPFSRSQERLLLVLALFALLVPNTLFLYAALARPDLVVAALRNPVALLFVTEAFLLMLLGAGLLHRAGARRPGPLAFLALSLAGSLLFSVPLFLYLASRRARSGAGGRDGRSPPR